eukprot:CAMPEP_0115718762 /NCGR_PEP_ID=MMETSP0272-20121206/77610_1 /TAXON_ID=71861 /ORGANISM="Scrippsiella trochoidea, Strain CCMP3099" /LENGTH=36 /DNA_ID= /DNA_START= /DNA_END= /DNA_ORIENTATION=
MPVLRPQHSDLKEQEAQEHEACTRNAEESAPEEIEA